MAHSIEIVQATKFEGYGLIVEFSDGTLARYTAEELLELRPYREQADGLKKWDGKVN